MAKRKTKKAANGKFVVLHSSCGGVAQLEAFHSHGYATADAARTAAVKAIDNGDLYDPGAVVVAEIVDVAKSQGLTWTGKTTL